MVLYNIPSVQESIGINNTPYSKLLHKPRLTAGFMFHFAAAKREVTTDATLVIL